MRIRPDEGLEPRDVAGKIEGSEEIGLTGGEPVAADQERDERWISEATEADADEEGG